MPTDEDGPSPAFPHRPGRRGRRARDPGRDAGQRGNRVPAVTAEGIPDAEAGVMMRRLVNFWMPIPAGAIAYVTLKVPRGAGLRAMRQAVTGMMSRNEVSAAPPTPADGEAEPPATPAAQADGQAEPPATPPTLADGQAEPPAIPPAQADRKAAQADRHGDRTGGPARGDSVLGDAP